MDPENKKDDSHGHCVGGSPINDVDNLNNDIPSTSYDPRNSSRQRLAARLNFRSFLETGEAMFVVPSDGPLNPLVNSNQNVFDGSDFLNINQNVQPELDDEDEYRVALPDKFNVIRSSMHNITPDGGVIKKVIRAGQRGKFPGENFKVWIHYKVVANDKVEPIDDQFARKEPPIKERIKEFKLGCGEVLQALDIAVKTMELNELAKFLSTSKYAYGKLGVPELVGEDSDVLFTVELVAFFENPDLDNKQVKISFIEIEQLAVQYKVEGNSFYNKGYYTNAVKRYFNAMKVLDVYVTPFSNEEKRRQNLLFILYSNMAQAYLCEEKYTKVIDLCRKAFELSGITEGNRIKVYLRLAQAQTALDKYEEAKETLKQARNVEPGNVQVRDLYEEITKKQK